MSDLPTFPPRQSTLRPVLGYGLLSLMAGVIGAGLLLWLYPGLRQTVIPPGAQSVIVQSPGKVVVEEGTQLKELAIKTGPFVGLLYRKNDAQVIGNKTIYPPETAYARAILLTSDGWFSTIISLKPNIGDQLVVNGVAYPVERLVADTSSPYIMGKVNGRSFPVTSFSDERYLYPGATIFALPKTDSVFVGHVVSGAMATIDGTLSSDKIIGGIAITTDGTLAIGAPVFDLSGGLVGQLALLQDRVTVAPAVALSTMLKNVLSSGALTRPLVGLTYRFLTAAELNDSRSGALITSIDKLGPLGKLPLKVGDLIIAVNGSSIQHPGDVLRLVLESDGGSFSIQYEHEGKTSELTANLKK